MSHAPDALRYAANLPVLTARESELYEHLLATPLDLPGIARIMGIRPGTVKLHSSRIYAKLNVSGRHALQAAEIARLRAELAATGSRS